MVEPPGEEPFGDDHGRRERHPDQGQHQHRGEDLFQAEVVLFDPDHRAQPALSREKNSATTAPISDSVTET